MAEEPVPPGELTALHARINVDLAELRRRLRPRQLKVRLSAARPARVVIAAVDALRAVRAAPSVAARVGVALLVVAGVAALLARGRRGDAPRSSDQP